MSEKPKRQRFAGILLHPTSLPGRGGIGDIGAPAHHFIHFLAEAAQTLWQVCPLGPTGFGDSPYAALSAFAGNPLLLSLESLVKDGFLDQSERDSYPGFAADQVNYEGVVPAKSATLKKAGERFHERAGGETRKEFEAFCKRRASWLDDFALFMAVRKAHNGDAWPTWEPPLARREPAALKQARKDHAEAIEGHKALQFLFFRQWAETKKLANDNHIRIIGDAPIFVAHDSADVWARPDLFFLGADGQPSVVSGVPPDYFSPQGQRWGNPIYRWREKKKEVYQWWVERLRVNLEMVDIIRLDHFRGFDAYWESPANEPTTLNGRWVKGPGADFFRYLRDQIGSLPLIAEDLGVITPRVDALRKEFGLPGMKILQFAFGDDAANPYLPHNIESDCVVYTGTHDNDTTRGWYQKAGEAVQDRVRRYLWCEGANIHLDLIRSALMSTARIAIIPLQDVLGLGGEARMNVPGVAEGNWKWRVTGDQLNSAKAGMLRYLTELYGRGEPPVKPAGEKKEPRLDPDLAAEK